MARVKLRCIMGCSGLKSSYREKRSISKYCYDNEINKTKKWSFRYKQERNDLFDINNKP